MSEIKEGVKEIEVTRPKVLDCDLYQIKIGANKWLVFAGLLDGKLFELFISHNNNEDSDILYIPKFVDHGTIKKVFEDDNIANKSANNKRFDFTYKDKHDYNVTLDGIERVTDPKFHNIIISVSFMLRYLPNGVVIKIIERWVDHDELTRQLNHILINIISKYNDTKKNKS